MKKITDQGSMSNFSWSRVRGLKRSLNKKPQNNKCKFAVRGIYIQSVYSLLAELLQNAIINIINLKPGKARVFSFTIAVKTDRIIRFNSEN